MLVEASLGFDDLRHHAYIELLGPVDVRPLFREFLGSSR